MERVLVFGGTRFFGKKLVESLIRSGCDVTIATRGKTIDPFGDRVKRVQLDRSMDDSRWDEISSVQWDLCTIIFVIAMTMRKLPLKDWVKMWASIFSPPLYPFMRFPNRFMLKTTFLPWSIISRLKAKSSITEKEKGDSSNP